MYIFNDEIHRTIIPPSEDLAESFFGAPSCELQGERWLALKQAFNIQTHIPPELLPGLVVLEEKHRQIETTKIREYLATPQFLGLAPVSRSPVLRQGEDTDWIGLFLQDDPMFNSKENKLYVPKHSRNDLEAIQNEGIDFDLLYSIHQILPEIWRPGQPLPTEYMLPTIPLDLIRRVNQYSNIATTARNIAFTIIKAAIDVGKAVVTTTAVAGAIVAGAAAITGAVAGAATIGAVAAAGSLLLLDPVLIGINLHPTATYQGNPIGSWYLITRWDW